MKSNLIPILFFATVAQASAFAADPRPTLGEPTFEGTGCKAGTLSWVLSPDEATLSVLFDDYRVEAGNGTRAEAKYCAISFPINIPVGQYLTILQADYRGFNSLPKGATSAFQADYEFEGSSDPKRRKSKQTKGPVIGDFIETSTDQARSPCGGTRNLKIHTTLSVQSNSQQDQAISQLDSKDMTSPAGKKDRKMRYKMVLKRCNGANR